MARDLQVGETVYIPRARLGLKVDTQSAFWRTTVSAKSDRSITVTLPNGQYSTVAASAVHRRVGLLVVRIGDLGSSETTLLDPLAKSVLQYLRLLLSDDFVSIVEVRGLDELTTYWERHHAAYTHVIIVAHGRNDGVRFAVDGWVGPDTLGSRLPACQPEPKSVISLCCRTGYADFSRELSNAQVCEAIVAPFHDVHGAVASQFCQTLFAYHMLQGETFRVAFKHARGAVPGGSVFRMWSQGEKVPAA